jgi:hypothetical protein
MVEQRDGARPATVVVIDVQGLVDADLDLIDALARLRLAVHRARGSVVLRDATRELQELLVFAGLDEVLPCCDRLRLGIELEREAEQREQRGVDEVGDAGDPVA